METNISSEITLLPNPLYTTDFIGLEIKMF